MVTYLPLTESHLKPDKTRGQKYNRRYVHEIHCYRSISISTGLLVLTRQRHNSASRRSFSQRIGRDISKGVRIPVVKVAHTKRTGRLVIIPNLRFRINVFLYASDKNAVQHEKRDGIHRSNDAIHSEELNRLSQFRHNLL